MRFQLAPTNGGKGFEVVFPKEWVAKALPYVKVGLTVLKVAAIAGKLSGIPIPDVTASASDWVDAQLAMLSDLKEEAIAQMSDLTGDPVLAQRLLKQAMPAMRRCAHRTRQPRRVLRASEWRSGPTRSAGGRAPTLTYRYRPRRQKKARSGVDARVSCARSHQQSEGVQGS